MTTRAVKPGFLIKAIALSLILIAAIGQAIDWLVFSPQTPSQLERSKTQLQSALVLMRALDNDTLQYMLPQLSQTLGFQIELLPAASVHMPPADPIDDVIIVSQENFFYFYAVLDQHRTLQAGPIPQEPSYRVAELSLTFIFYGLIAAIFFYWLLPLIKNLDKLSHAADAFLKKNTLKALEIDTASPIFPLAQTFNKFVDTLSETFRHQMAMFRTLSHELRTPLSRIKFSLALINHENLPKDSLKYINEIDANLTHLEHLIDQMLRYSKIEHARDQLRIEHVPIIDILHDMQTSFRLTATVSVHIDATNLDPNVTLAADPHLLNIALSNLLQNAVRHAQTRVSLRVTCTQTAIEFYIEDDGAGISEAETSALFKPFIHTKTHPDGRKSYGLGLAIVQHIMQMHNGCIEYKQSMHLHGACFVLIFPTEHNAKY